MALIILRSALRATLRDASGGINLNWRMCGPQPGGADPMDPASPVYI